MHLSYSIDEGNCIAVQGILHHKLFCSVLHSYIFQNDIEIILASQLEDVLKAAFETPLPALEAVLPSKL